MSKWIDVINMVQGEIEEVLALFVNGKVNSAIVSIVQGKRGKCKGRK